MKNPKPILAVMLGTLLLPAIASASTNFDLQKIGDGVYAVIVKPGNIVGSNGAVIINKDDVLIIDTHYRPSMAAELMAEVRRLTPKPIRYVVNTHWHNDHTQGNEAYVNAFPNVEYLSHINTRRDIIGKAIPSIADALASTPTDIANMEKAAAAATDPAVAARMKGAIADRKAYLEELKHMQITLPTLTFDHSMILHRGTREIQ